MRCVYVFYLLSRCMRPEGPWQRLAAALADSSLFYTPLHDRILSPTTVGTVMRCVELTLEFQRLSFPMRREKETERKKEERLEAGAGQCSGVRTPL